MADEGAEMIDRAYLLVSELPGVEIGPSWGRPSLKVNGKAFAGHSREPGALYILCPLDLKELLIEADPEVFFETDHYRGWPAILVRMDAADDETLRARLEAAWEQKAPKKLVKAWRQEGASVGQA